PSGTATTSFSPALIKRTPTRLRFPESGTEPIPLAPSVRAGAKSMVSVGSLPIACAGLQYAPIPDRAAIPARSRRCTCLGSPWRLPHGHPGNASKHPLDPRRRLHANGLGVPLYWADTRSEHPAGPGKLHHRPLAGFHRLPPHRHSGEPAAPAVPPGPQCSESGNVPHVPFRAGNDPVHGSGVAV